MMEDWRFKDSPYVELGGLVAYAGAPLRLQNESGDCVGLGSLCVASSTEQEPLTRPQQNTLARLADWVVSDIVQCTRARRQRERHRMSGLISSIQGTPDDAVSKESILEMVRTTYPDAAISLQSSTAAHLEVEGRSPISQSDLKDGLWEDLEYLDDFIANSNHQEFPSTRVVRVMAAQCESISGTSLLVVASKDFRLVFDDIDTWFVQTCASMLSQTWQKRLLAEVMRRKEDFLRGICHQLRTPIHGILGSAELLAEELKQRNAGENTHPTSPLLQMAPAVHPREPFLYLDTIRTAGRELISIVNSMITLNRWADIAISDRRYAVHTVYELETELAEEIRKAISGTTRRTAPVIFSHNHPPGCDSLRTDLSLLRDSLLPLVINAIQHTTEGVIAVTTTVRPDSKELIVDVKDTGRGIHPDHQERIFEPYEKVDAHSAGAGLGLTLAFKFAALLRGSVVLLSSDINCGSHFRATFREVECELSTPPPQSLVSKLKNIPSKFYSMASSSAGALLCDYFAGFLTSHGVTPSDSLEDCSIILDFIPNPTERHAALSQMSSQQVAICLVAASEREASFERPPSNVIYVNGPFLTSTMSQALEEADRILSEIKTSRPRHEAPPMSPKLDEGTRAYENTSTDGDTTADESPSTNGSMSADESPATEDEWVECHSPLSKPQPTSPPGDNPADPELDTAVQRTCPPDLAPPVETSVAVSIPAALTESRPVALLVDDNAINLRILQMYCNKRGLPYYCATDGLQAVEKFSQCQSSSATGEGPAIQLILMDLQMPLCDGIEATRQIRLLEREKSWGKSTLFIVTGQDSPADRTDAESVGADEYFVKPVGIKVLDGSIKRHFPAFEPCG